MEKIGVLASSGISLQDSLGICGKWFATTTILRGRRTEHTSPVGLFYLVKLNEVHLGSLLGAWIGQ